MLKSTLQKALMGAAVAAVFSNPFAAAAQTMTSPANGALAKGDEKIVIGMAQGNMAEVAAAKLALANGQSAEVKTFAQQMVDDHTKALADVTALAQAKGVTLPADVDPKHEAMAAKLAKLKGAKFDQTYMAQAGVNDHKQMHAKLKKDEAAAKDADVKALAAKMLPTVEQHLHHAMEASKAAAK